MYPSDYRKERESYCGLNCIDASFCLDVIVRFAPRIRYVTKADKPQKSPDSYKRTRKIKYFEENIGCGKPTPNVQWYMWEKVLIFQLLDWKYDSKVDVG